MIAFLSLLFNFLSACFLSNIFKNITYVFLILFSIIILNVEILSIFTAIDKENILILSLIEFLITYFIYKKVKPPIFKFDTEKFMEITNSIFQDKSLLILSFFWIFLIIVSFLLAAFSPVNEPDAQGYHALRALFWAQNGTISHFDIPDIRCHSMPINSELFYTYILALSKNDTTFGLLEFFSYFLLIISSFKLMKFFDIDITRRIWAILIFTSFAGVLSQISSTQTDVIIGALFTASMYLFFEYKNDPKIHYLYFSALSLALAFGTKSTGVIGAFAILIYFFIYFIKNKKLKNMGQFLLFLILNFLVFSSYNYILNFINYGAFLGSKSALIGHGFWGGIGAVFANFIRYIFQFFDFSGFTLGFYLNKNLLKMQYAVIEFFNIERTLGVNVGLNYTNISMTEQFLGFGILGFLCFLPCSIIGFFKKKYRLFSIIFWAQILTLSFSIAYMVYSIRFIVSFVALAIPLLSISYFKKMNIIKFVYIFFAIFYMGYASLFLSQRPMFHLFSEVKKVKDVKIVQDKMRDLNYDFYPSFNEAYTMKNAVLPYCTNNNKIMILTSSGYMLYSTKFLELNNNCKIDTPALHHIRDYDLKKYDIIIAQKKLPYESETINKNDIKDPFISDYRAACNYIGIDSKRMQYLLGEDEIDRAKNVVCKINPNYIKSEGFVEGKTIEADIPNFLKDRENETVKDFILYEKK